MSKTVYSVVVPVYNEELVIEESYKRIKSVMDSTNESYEIIFVNDGSKDRTRSKAEQICNRDKNVKLINFSRNFGHQAAITAGMKLSSGDAVIVIDADLQDPPEVMIEMIKKWKEGYDVVYGKRVKREGESFFKKFTAKAFYRLLKFMTNIDIPVDAGDFRLIDRKVCNVLSSLPERNRYIRGLVSWAGFKQTAVEFIRQERFAGESKYPLKKMIKLAIDGITSFSYKPLTFASLVGGIATLVGIISTIVIFLKNIISDEEILSLGFILEVNIAMFGLILGWIGIMGEYIGRIMDESRGRPLYIIESILNYKEIPEEYGKNI
jgi:dolichol-phosphate mannosyltransferase